MMPPPTTATRRGATDAGGMSYGGRRVGGFGRGLGLWRGLKARIEIVGVTQI
jgi:hypothetical protein